jgi:polyhydroxybutyrate depolymerase
MQRRMRLWPRLALASLAAVSVLVSWFLTGDPRVGEMADFDYRAKPTSAACPASAAGAVSLRTPRGVAFEVRAPRNYDARYAHPLLVVYAPAGMDRLATERFTGLSIAATAAGFVVAYVDHSRLILSAIGDLGAVAEIVARGWCIDRRFVFLTGHSDGGTVATALALSAEPSGRYAGIAPSAAGFTGADLREYRCPAPLGVLVLHGRADELFPGFGKQAAGWWARCNGCAGEPEPRADGCMEYRGCAPAGRTVYCEHGSRHAVWPAYNQTMIDFFAEIARAS